MKKHIFLLLLLTLNLASAQKSEKVKGSKIASIEQREINNFDFLEIGDNFEVYLDRGEKNELKIEADENLQSIVNIDSKANTLRITTSKTVTNYNKLILRITYTDELKAITVKDDVILNAIQEIQLDDISINAFDNTILNLNVNSSIFSLKLEQKSKTELNLKSKEASIQMSKNTSLKALISSVKFKCDLYQKSKTTLEGEVEDALIRLDNNTVFIGKNLFVKKAELISENYSKCSVNINETISIDASGNSEIELYGTQKIELKRFADNAVLFKKPTE